MSENEQIIIEVTQACNHACVHCYNYWFDSRAPAQAPGALSRGEIRRLVHCVKASSPLRNVAFSGGEPLLRADLADIARDTADEGLQVTVITNGHLLTEARCRRFPDGTVFELTLFSAEASLHDRIAGCSGAFRRVIEAATTIHRHKKGLAVSCVVSRMNLAGLERTLELAIALGAEAIVINRVNLTARTLPLAEDLVPPPCELRQALAVAERTASKAGTTFALSVPIPPCLVSPSRYPHLHFGWCPRGGSGAYYTVGYNGLVRPCNHSSLILGDVRRQDFHEIVKARSARAFWAAVPTTCRQCHRPLAKQCRGGCPAASHECYGTGTRIDPFVEFALRQSPSQYTIAAQTGL